MVLPLIIGAFLNIQTWAAPVDDILNKSSFLQKPKTMLGGVVDQYDPILISLVASLKSREPARIESQWEDLELSPQKDYQGACPGVMKAKMLRSRSGSPMTFVIMPGSYATYKNGS